MDSPAHACVRARRVPAGERSRTRLPCAHVGRGSAPWDSLPGACTVRGFSGVRPCVGRAGGAGSRRRGPEIRFGARKVHFGGNFREIHENLVIFGDSHQFHPFSPKFRIFADFPQNGATGRFRCRESMVFARENLVLAAGHPKKRKCEKCLILLKK